MKKYIIILILLELISCFTICAFAQSVSLKIDSLRKVLQTRGEDTNKVNTLNELSAQLWNKMDYKSSMQCATQALSLAKKLNFEKGEGDAYFNIGEIYYLEEDYPSSFNNYSTSLKNQAEYRR